MGRFEALDAQVLGISANASFSQKAFADSLHLTFPLLSDFPRPETIKAYGIERPGGGAIPNQRAYFIVDKQGIVRFKRVMKNGRELLPDRVLLEALKKINQEQ